MIADANISLLSGLDLMSEVKKINPETFFMILTGYSRDYSYEKIIRAGAKISSKNRLPSQNWKAN